MDLEIRLAFEKGFLFALIAETGKSYVIFTSFYGRVRRLIYVIFITSVRRQFAPAQDVKYDQLFDVIFTSYWFKKDVIITSLRPN